MLDTTTKKRIDDCRDILVGKLPDPKAQIEQITIALIYKFMDDMDKESIDLGGTARFFSADYEKYSWDRLFDTRVSSAELLKLYSEAIESMEKNPNIPQLFRDIFKNAYLPYRDPETLRLFLKTIGEFEYTHSEKLGDAFEYLLSVMGSQGDAGQFRTPRHIIDFIVEIVNPQKIETVLDPACGTAGFLISAFKHIKNQAEKNQSLTPDENKRLIQNFTGYDISPDMVRLSLVNLYLHGFLNPEIIEYDTLTSEERWNETFDVILANPPFMSPKGGIRPHKRFSVTSNRSEVLFVDYIAEHLNPNGRAGIIVPEGIIFQSGKAYKNLRKMLVEHCLWAVVSLPAGVFNPYSGVKTSILLMDKNLAKKTDHLLFVKIENDGFNLGAQRTPVKGSQLPEAIQILKGYCKSDVETRFIASPQQPNHPIAHPVKKSKIAENGEYNLSRERYKDQIVIKSDFKIVELKEVADVISGQSPKSEFYNELGQGIPFYQGKTNFGSRYIKSPTKWTTSITKEAFKSDILMSVRAPVGPVNYSNQHICIGRGLAAIRINNKIINDYLFYLLKSKENNLKGNGGLVFDSISRSQIEAIKIPLPPLSIQQEIVAEIDSYQKIIDGAKMVVENYKPQIKIDPEWEMVKFDSAPFEIIDGDRGKNYPKGDEFRSNGYCLFLNTKNVKPDGFNFSETMYISKDKDNILRKGKLERYDVILTTRGTVGNTALYHLKVPYQHIRINSGMLIFRPNKSKLFPDFLFYFFQSENFKIQTKNIISGSAQPQLPIKNLKNILIPFPSLETQTQIVSQIEKEQALVNANKDLIKIYEQKIKDKIDEVWGE